jgi:hypothetical protein
MASTTWQIRGVDTLGQDLVLSRIVPWGALGAITPTAISSTFAPISGALANLAVDSSAQCVFAGVDVQKPGFAIEFTFAQEVDLWGFRFAGPSASTWPVQHAVATGVLSASLKCVQWLSDGVLSPAPSKALVFTNEAGLWLEQPAAGSQNWFGCAASADGATLFATPYGSTSWLSRDGGLTWAAQTAAGSRNWRGCAVSADGMTLLTVAVGGSPWLSKDGGQTWIAQTAAVGTDWMACAVSADGKTLIATAYGTTPWLSKDAGQTWVAQAAMGSRNWFGCAVSADGKTLLCAAQGHYLWLSKDAGATWDTQNAPGSRFWRGCAVSSDGLTFLAVDSNGTPWLTIDAGSSWSAQTVAGTRNWYSCSVSADGRTLIAASESVAPLWLSKDKGATWSMQSSLGSGVWVGAAVSADGLMLMTGKYGGGLYLSMDGDRIYTSFPVQGGVAHGVLFATGTALQAQGRTSTTCLDALPFNDFEFGGNGQICGTVECQVTPANVPLRRRVRLHRSRDGMLVRETWSHPDGSYAFMHISLNYEYDVIAWDHDMSYRSVIANNLKPEVMP